MTTEITIIDNKTGSIIETPKAEIQIQDLIKRYNTGIGKTVEGILEMSKAVYEATEIKSKKYKTEFFNQVNLDRNSSMAKKLKSIGERYEVFLNNKDHLPSAWTSIYQLTKLDDEKLIDLIENDVINPAIKGSEVNQLVGYIPKTNVKKEATEEKVVPMNEEDIQFTVTFKGHKYSKIKQLVEMITTLSEAEVISYVGNENFKNSEQSILLA